MMISKLLYKELRLAAHPTMYIFTLLGALVLVPAYPYGLVFMFGSLAPSITFMYCRETRDMYYTLLLPVPKRAVVAGKCALTVSMQLTMLAVAAIFALLRTVIGADSNPVGIEPNVAYFGFGLTILAVFDFVFLTQFYKTAYKVGKAFALAMVPEIILILAMETSSHIPALALIDGTSAPELVTQLPILAAGAIIYAAVLLAAYKISARRFESVDV